MSAIGPEELARIFAGTPRSVLRKAALSAGYTLMMIGGQGLKGEESPDAKLTDDDVRAIRLARKRGEKVLALAAHYGVSEAIISRVANRQRWAHVADEAAE